MTSKAAKVGLFKDGDLRNFDDLKVIHDLKNASSDGFPMSMLASTLLLTSQTNALPKGSHRQNLRIAHQILSPYASNSPLG
jgi:hypothetical protein